MRVSTLPSLLPHDGVTEKGDNGGVARIFLVFGLFLEKKSCKKQYSG